jgi:outer membrane protein OmpA-like peptidoglycan-associated protein
MWKPRPWKWLLWALPMVALPTLAAVWLNTSSLFRDISARSTERLFAIGANWAVPLFDGRDVTLGGDAPNQEAIDKALDALSGVYGIRTVNNGARVVAPVPVTLLAPQINSLASTPLADDTFDVTAENSGGTNPAIGTTPPAKLVVDTVAPAAPAITPVANGIEWPFTLNGTWVEDGATSLTAKLANQTWTIGKDRDLKSDGKGNWSFAPVIDLRPGTYDVTMEASDQAGNTSKSVLAAAIVIRELPAAPATPIPAPIPVATEAIGAAPTLTTTTVNVKAPAVPLQQAEPPLVQTPAPASAEQSVAAQPVSPAYDCAGALAEISAAFPIRFAFNDTQLKPPLDVGMNQYATLLKDSRCATMRAEVAGHADFLGPKLSNQALSEARAQSVVSALVAAGVDAPRLRTQGFSESMPADTEKSAAARQKNRRVEIILVK